MDLSDLGRLAHETPKDELPVLLGKLVEVEARVRMRLAEVVTTAPVQAATGLIHQLREHGFEPIGVELSELLKAGGSVKCCTLELRAA